LQWYDTLQVSATPLVPEDSGSDKDVQPAREVAVVADNTQGSFPDDAFAANDVEHEDAVRKQRVCRKRAVDSAFKARQSSRLAEKEAP
jgi:hypothetical protein